MTESTEVAVKQQNETVKDFFTKHSAKIQEALPAVGLTPERVAQAALMVINSNDMLKKCDKNTLFSCVVQAASLGLTFSPALGQAYLVPFKDNKTGGVNCQLIIGYRGKVTLARRSKSIKSIHAFIVHEKDNFKLTFGVNPSIEHTINPGERGEAIGCYVVAKLMEGGEQWEYMTAEEIHAIRQKSRAANAGPWVSNPLEMWKKTVMHRLFKWLPIAIDDPLHQAMEVEQPHIEADFIPDRKPSAAERLAAELPPPLLLVDNPAGDSQELFPDSEN